MIPKIQSAAEKERKERKTRIWMAIVVTVLLGASTAAYALMETGTTEKKVYNGITFYRTENGWQPKKMDIVTSYLPQDVENITIDGNIKLNDFSGVVYVNALGNADLNAANELIRTLKVNKATLSCSPKNENESFCAELPIKSCDDAASGSGVIIFENSNETSVSYDNYCLTIKTDSENTLKVVDRIIFGLYGIIKT